MTCSYCGTRNADGEHRCRRCGRRPDDTLTGEFGLVRTEGALAAKPDAEAAARTTEAATRPAPQLVAQTAAAASDDRKGTLSRAVQSSLFHEKSGLKVVPIAEYAPAPPRVARPKAPAKPGQRRARPVC